MSKLLAISLIVSVLGIFILLFFALSQSPEKISRNSAEYSYVQAEGRIISIKNYNEFNIIQLDSNITVVCNKCILKTGQKILVTGVLEDYQGTMQINAEEIKIIN